MLGVAIRGPASRHAQRAAMVTCASILTFVLPVTMPAGASSAPAHVAADRTGAAVRAPANDPTDGDFEAIFTPVFVHVAAVEAPTSRLAGAFKSLNQLFGVQTRFDEDVVALSTSLDRAKEAAVAGDQLWLGRQADSSAQYALEAFSILKEFPSLNAAVKSAFVADGFALKVTPKQFAAGQTYLAQHGLSPESTHVLGVAAGALRPQTSAEVKALSALLLDPTIFEQAIARASPTSMDLPAVLDALTSAEDRAAVAFQSYADHILHPTTTKNAQFRGLANACSGCEEQEPTGWSEVAENEHHLTQFAEGVEAAAKQASSFFGQLGNSGAAEGLEHAAEGAETGGQIAGYAFAAAAFWAASDAFGMPGGGGGGGTGYTDGDPHLQALNGDDYDFQAAGEFTLVRSGDGLDVQVRQQPAYGSDTVAWDTAVAMLVVGKRVEIDPGAPLRVLVDGHRVQLRGSVPLRLSGGEVYLDHEGDVIVKWPDGSEADVYADFLGENVTFTSAPYLVGKLTGLLTADATPEVKPGVTSTKEVLIGGNGKRYTFDASTKSGFLTLYRDFAPSWQITQAESLFTYSPGKSTRSYRPQGLSKSRIQPRLDLARPVGGSQEHLPQGRHHERGTARRLRSRCWRHREGLQGDRPGDCEGRDPRELGRAWTGAQGRPSDDRDRLCRGVQPQLPWPFRHGPARGLLPDGVELRGRRPGPRELRRRQRHYRDSPTREPAGHPPPWLSPRHRRRTQTTSCRRCLVGRRGRVRQSATTRPPVTAPSHW